MQNAGPDAPNEGARLLRNAGTIEEVATETRLSRRSILNWRNGAIPNDDSRATLRSALGIPTDAWRSPPQGVRLPPWYDAARVALVGFPAAADALTRYLIEETRDPAALATHDADVARRRARYPELYDAAVAAERGLNDAELAADEREATET